MMLLALLAATAAPACTVPPPPPVACIRKGDPPAGFARWDSVMPTAEPLAPGGAIAVRLSAMSGIDGKAGCGGLAKLLVTKPGTYGIALSGGAWIDLFGKEGPLTSVAHAHGPACSGIAKTVDFTLKPGRYVLRLSKAAGTSIKVMAVRRSAP